MSRGSPARPLTGPAAGRPADLAAGYLREHGSEADLTPDDVVEATVTSETRGRHNGITHVYLRQRVDGREVAGADSNVNVGSNGAVLSFGTTFLPEVRESINRTVPELSALAATSAALASVGLTTSEPLAALDVRQGPEQETLFSDGGVANGRIAAKLVYQPVDLRDVRLAWQIDIDEKSGQHLWQITVDAATGEVLNHEDFVVEDNWDLPSRAAANRAAALTQKKPLDTIIALSSPTPVFDGSKYRVFAMPKESPNDGPQTLVENPADVTASPYGWHDTNQLPGADFTLTRGNNVHAYVDQDSSNAPDAGYDVDGGSGLTFDWTANLSEHAQNYREAVVSNLFYWNNVFHDVLYRYGFDEASGNFQANNYGRGGLAGDYVRAEAADGSGTNNANFATPSEPNSTGAVPRMQMYLWPGDQFGLQNQVVVDGAGSFDASWARFSAAPGVAGTSGTFVNAGNGCAPADYAAPPTSNWIAIVTGNNTGCSNVDKARQAAAAGARALVVANTSSSRPVLTGSLTTPAPAIPVASVNLADGNAIRAAIASNPAVTGTVRKHPNHPGIRDGDFENGIVLHEYGHGVSIRLTGGPAVNCLTGDEQGGEGWSDYFAMIMTLNPAIDSGDGQRGMGPYALFQPNRQGAGIRPRPYSRTMEIQPFTYDSIKSGGWLNGGTLAAPHGIGHGWASLLWDMTWDLIDKHGFNPDLYGPWNSGGNNRALQYVIDGLKLQGCSPGFVTARNAIIQAAEALDSGDACTIWASFARRGLGYSAVQGGTGRTDNTEAFDTHPACRASFSSSVAAPPSMNVANVGSTIPLSFSVPGAQGGDILAKNSPYSRQVECTTLRTLDPNAQFITPRPYPTAMLSPGGSGLQYNRGSGHYTFTWQTDAAWAGTCREAVFTRKDGVQHRAYFFFDSSPSFAVSGHVRDSSGQAVPNVSVKIAGSA
ncbi:MAG TPA: M36 family metallopeptidase, partial [Thermoanaerobaculia bacterium]